ncbi:hypothetical protein ACJIZ3_006794 [Penstemon smallii]|uniref:Uncharacterized protein n=1 Tax=Penstemon smallii TaxID=265156 RepID=A0ABD3S8R8_9LAMI
METELYKPQPIGFSVPSATRTASPVMGGGENLYYLLGDWKRFLEVWWWWWWW